MGVPRAGLLLPTLGNEPRPSTRRVREAAASAYFSHAVSLNESRAGFSQRLIFLFTLLGHDLTLRYLFEEFSHVFLFKVIMCSPEWVSLVLYRI